MFCSMPLKGSHKAAYSHGSGRRPRPQYQRIGHAVVHEQGAAVGGRRVPAHNEFSILVLMYNKNAHRWSLQRVCDALSN